MPKRQLRAQTAEEVLRELDDRVRRLEQRQHVTLGPWVLQHDQGTGDLTARYAPTGAVTVLAAP